MVKDEGNARRLRRRYQKWYSEGKCTRCGGERDKPGKFKLCARCRATRRANNKRWRDKCANENRCINCGEPKEPQATGVYCLECAQRNYYKVIYSR